LDRKLYNRVRLPQATPQGRLVPEFVNRHPPIINEDDYLVEDNAMDDICLSPELDGTLDMPTFEHSSGSSKLLRRTIQRKRHNSECKLGTKCKCLRKHQDTTKRNLL
jgi:hypothetical protein